MSSRAYFITTDEGILARLDEIQAADTQRISAIRDMLAALGYENGYFGEYGERRGPLMRKSPVTLKDGFNYPTAAQERLRKLAIASEDPAHKLLRFERHDDELYEVISPRGNTKAGKLLKAELDAAFEALPPGMLAYVTGHAWNKGNAFVRAMGYGAREVMLGSSMSFGTLMPSNRKDVRKAVLSLPFEGFGEALDVPEGWGTEVTEREAMQHLKEMGYTVKD